MSEDEPQNDQPENDQPQHDAPSDPRGDDVAEDGPDFGAGEPTQPLSGWPAPSAQPSAESSPQAPTGPGYYGPPQTRTMPASMPAPGSAPAFGGYRPMPAVVERRGFPAAAWLAVAGLALVLGLVGGLLGAGLLEASRDDSAGSGRGLDTVATREVAPLDADNGSVAAVAEALLPSTVQILADYDGEVAGATGSGFVLDRDGHIVTNNHVVASAAADDGSIVVIDHSGTRHDATVVGRSPVYDLAVLQIEEMGNLEPAALGASKVLRVGDSVIAFGSPLGLSQTVTSGIVSALDRPVTTGGESEQELSYINAVQTDAAINPGNSGGPLVNLGGEVVGVNSAIATTGGGLVSGESGNIGVGFAIPIEQVRTTVDQILRTGKAEYPVIGAKVRTGGDAGGAGAQITEIVPNTPAARAGLKKDDVVTEVEGQPVSDGIALIVAIRTHLPGDEIEFTVMRGDSERKVMITLDGEVG